MFLSALLLLHGAWISQARAGIADILASSRYRSAQVGILVVDAETGKEVFSHYADRPLIPASNMKVVISVTALGALGSGFKFKTPVYRQGNVTNGVLKGNLAICGRGDPNLSGRFHDGDALHCFRNLAAQVAASGIKRIEGDIVGDDSYFDRELINPGWPDDQLQNWYCAPINALSANDNCISVGVRPPAGSSVAVIGLSPPTRFFEIRNTCKSGRTNAVAVYRSQGTNSIIVSGTIKSGVQGGIVTVHDPALFTTTLFREQLESAGIKVTGKTRLIGRDETVSKSEKLKVAEWVSGMPETLKAMNKNSQNFYAEMMLKTIGAVFRGKGTTKNGHEVIKEVMTRLGVSKEHYVFEDGCGLARGNRVSARLLTTLLAYSWKKPAYRQAMLDSLPVGGVDGTLSRRFRENGLKEQVFAKTGYVSRAGSLSGYCKTKNGRWLVFSILVNDMNSNGEMKSLQDEVVRYLVKNF